MSDKMNEKRALVLGGGVAGLAGAYYLTRHKVEAIVFESGATPGGNCRTIERGGFRFDTGAHRFHDRNSSITKDVIELLGQDVINVNAPSKIFDSKIFHRKNSDRNAFDGTRLISFPIQPSDIFKKMDISYTILAAMSLLKAKIAPERSSSFEDYAVSSYGRMMSERFLLNYSAKLWGIPCSDVSADIAGKRLKGINLLTLLLSFLSRGVAQRAHYEGAFLYPVGGIQKIAERLTAAIGYDRVLTGKRVTGLRGENGRITQIEVNTDETIEVGPADCIVSTLPLPFLIQIMKPAVPVPVSRVADTLRFRNIRLAAYALNRSGVNGCATMYFPDRQYNFTRIYEPRNRYRGMSPEGKTMLVAEVPCFSSDDIWQAGDADFLDTIKRQIAGTGMMDDEEILSSYSVKMEHAYPVLEKDYAEKITPIFEYLSGFKNLYLTGRNAMFRYSWIHDMFQEGKCLAQKISDYQVCEN